MRSGLRGVVAACGLLPCPMVWADGGNAKAPGVERAGDFLQLMIPSYALGMAMNEGASPTGSDGVGQFGKSMAGTLLLVHGLKRTTQQERPDHESGDGRDSFPSGHTAAAFAGASFIHMRYGLSQAAVPYALAAFVGYSRIECDRHHPRDVLAGAAIASFSSWLFVDEYSPSQPRLNVSADAGSGKIQATFRIRF